MNVIQMFYVYWEHNSVQNFTNIEPESAIIENQTQWRGHRSVPYPCSERENVSPSIANACKLSGELSCLGESLELICLLGKLV